MKRPRDNSINSEATLTRTGSIRKGFDYQDTYALLRIADWIEHPKEFVWMKLEAREAGFLDDIVIANAESQSVSLFQVKYGVHPDTPESAWDLDTLLFNASGSSKPLFKKWFDSWLDFSGRKGFTSVSGALVTNRPASVRFKKCLRPTEDGAQKIDITTLAKVFPRRYRQALSQAGKSKLQLSRFLRSFTFYFDRPDLDKTKDQIRKRLERFGVDEKGWVSLQEVVRRWATHRNEPRMEGIIRLDDIRAAAGWVSPKALKQEFPIPMDFVLANHAMHRRLIKSVKSPPGGIAVISGGPGSGKSTYLSYLEGVLKKSGSICLRHHYFVRLDDPDRYRRLKPDVARESLLHDLLAAAPDSLGEKKFHNPHPKDLGTYIRTAANYLHERSQTLVLIVDGLDHVLSESESRELRDFLEDLLPVSEGLWLILGTRPIAAEQLPRAILERAPESSWLVMPGLGLNGCRQLLRLHRKELRLADHDSHLEDVASAFFRKTQGHPLYSRLCLSELLDRATLGYITASDVHALIPFTGEIEDTYNAVWERVSSEAKQVAVLLAVTGLPLDASHIIQCLTAAKQPAPTVLAGINELKPVLVERAGRKALFHFSFLEYVRQTTEFGALRLTILQSFKDWLLTSAPASVTWQNLTSVEFQLGQRRAVADQLTREWVIQSLCDSRPIDQIIDQLQLGVHAAMELGDFPRAHAVGMLHQYLNWAMNGENVALDKVSLLAWRTSIDAPSLIPPLDEISEFSSEGLREMAEQAAKNRRRDILNIVVDELNVRAGNLRTYDYSDIWWNDVRVFCDVWATAKLPVDAMARWARQFRKFGRSADLFGAYAKSLLTTGQSTSLNDLLSMRLLQLEKTRVLEAIAESSIIRNETKHYRYFDRHTSAATGPWGALYMALNGRRSSRMRMPDDHSLVDPTREHLEAAEERQYQSRFTGVYLASVASVLLGETSHTSNWIANLDTSVWSRGAAKTLATIGLAQGASLSLGQLPLYEAIFDALREFEIPSFPEERDIWSAWKAFRKSVEDIVLVTAYLRNWAGAKDQLSTPLVHQMRMSAVLGRVSLQKILLASERPMLESGEIEAYLAEGKGYWHATVESFYERAETFADMATLAYKYKLPTLGRRLLEEAAENVMGYGYHKDLYLHEVLHSIEACHKAGSNRAMEWIRKVASIVQSVLDFTDGDETRHLPVYLAELLRKTDAQSLRAYYVDAVEQERLFLAEDIFPELVEATDFTDELELAVASTATDDDALLAIQKCGAEGKPGAKELMNSLADEYHRFPGPKRREQHDIRSAASDHSDDKDFLDKIQPSRVREHLRTISTRHDKNRFLVEWLGIWLCKDEKSRMVYELALEWVDSVGSKNVDKGIYDLLEPYAREFDIAGDDKAFDFFCRAYATSHGWTWFFQKFSEIEQRWFRLRSIYPERWSEFVRKTCIVEDNGFPVNRMTFLPVPRGVEFLAQFATLAEAENLTDSAVSTLEEMMAGLQLPKAEWLEKTGETDLWDVLYCRLTWPSPTVRERVATVLSALFLDARTSDLAIRQLHVRLPNVRLESLTTVMLLPLIKAVRKNPHGIAIRVEQLRDSIARPSVVTDGLLAEIERLIGANRS
jgi:NACHT domain